jgi:putative endonuclease
MRQFYIYILSSQKNGTLYVGVTSDIIKRVYEHKAKLRKGFTTNYNVTQLVYYEIWGTAHEAIAREKQLKAWKRKWKIDLIELKNVGWEDLYEKLI